VTPWQVVRNYRAVLERHKGESAAPYSDLPHSPEEIYNALNSWINWGENTYSTLERRYWLSLVIDLQNFLPDPDKSDPDLIWRWQVEVIDTI
jgi:hypothetical protein